MCFKAPKPPQPSVADKAEDAALQRQISASRDEERSRRSLDKEARFEDALALYGGSLGRRSLLTGGKGGMGFAPSMSRSLLT